MILESAPIDALAAEAHYFRAQQNHNNKEYEQSNEVIALLSQKFSSQPFGRQSLLLMAKNFNALNDAFQATYILESLITNYDQFPDIVTKGKSLLQQINEEQAKQNASLTQENPSSETLNYHLFFGVLLWGSFFVKAQEEGADDLGTQEVTVLKSYSPSLKDVFKIRSLPAAEDTLVYKKTKNRIYF